MSSDLQQVYQRCFGCRPLKGGHVSLGFSPGVRANKRPRRGRSEANQRSVCRGRRRRSGASEACRLRRDEGCGACADACPLCVVAEEGGTGEKPHRKGFSLRAPFCLLFRRGKSRPGCGGGTPISHRTAWYLSVRKRYFSPTRSATGESALHRPDALAQKYQKLTFPLCQTEWSPAPHSPRPPACRPRTPRAGRQSPAPGTGP